MSQLTIIRNGRILDPSQGLDKCGDLWISGGHVISPAAAVPDEAFVFDAGGCWVVPGLVDMHVHLREPGEEYKETIESGTRAAAVGGFCGVACMPNTSPVNDCRSVTRHIMKASEWGSARVFPVGALSKGSQGRELAEYADMKDAGIVAVSDDGRSVMNSQLMRRALEYAGSHDLLVISHAEDEAMTAHGCMNEGYVSTMLGLKGIPPQSESIMVYRELALAELTGTRIHIAHVSTAAALDLIRRAKDRGVRVTAETAPHYFTLTDEAVIGYNTNAKMNPPLRGEADRQAIREALADGTIDAIASDHAPHSILEKETEFDRASNGIIGLETSLPLTLALVREGVISAARLVELMSVSPTRILGVPGGTLKTGSVADITVVDPEQSYIFSEDSIVSKSRNSPFVGWQLTGRAVLTMRGGEVTHELNPAG